MLESLTHQIQDALEHLYGFQYPVKLTPPSQKAYGDLCCTAPLSLSKQLRQNPLQIAKALADRLVTLWGEEYLVSVAAPGFLNLRLSPLAWQKALKHLCLEPLLTKTAFQTPLLIEFVSANPTGDLHLGHGRGAVLGSALASIWRSLGRTVHTEFYLNDAGEQIQKLGRSAWNIYTKTPSGDEDYPSELIGPYLADFPPCEYDFDRLTELVKDRIITRQKGVLESLRVHFDLWVSEKIDLHRSGRLKETLEALQQADLTYESEGALWLNCLKFGEERDRVLLKSSGQEDIDRKPTYLAGDIAYHRYKFKRFPSLLNLWGADHQGQDLSLKLALRALGEDDQNLKVVFLQLVSLMEKGQEVRMSKRSGTLITIEEVVEKVGSDAFRLSMLLSHANHRLIFDIDLALREDEQNPVFYLQYSHARACGILRMAAEESYFDGTANDLSSQFNPFDFEGIGQILPADLSPQASEATTDLLLKLLFFDQEVHSSAESDNPSQIVHYLIELARLFHSFYGHCRVLQKELPELSMARLKLVQAFQRTMHQGLELLLISAPEKM